jgi:hypothetical protein
MALLPYPPGTTFAPGVHDWWDRANYLGYLQQVARAMLRKFDKLRTETDVKTFSYDRDVIRDWLGSTPDSRLRHAQSIENFAAYHMALRLPIVEHQHIEYPWRWIDARRGARGGPRDLRAAFEVLLDAGFYIEAYRLVVP